MTRLNRDTKVNSRLNHENMKNTGNLEAFHEISAKTRDRVGKMLVAGRLLDHMGKSIQFEFYGHKYLAS